MTRLCTFRKLVTLSGHLRVNFSPEFSSSARRCICTSTTKLTKKNDGGDDDYVYKEVEPPEPPQAHPIARTLRILKHDVRSLYNKKQEPLLPFSSHVDIVIIGGGILGSAIAYFIKERTPSNALRVIVIEKDPTYTRSATALSVGGLRQQFSLRENVQMAQYGAEFLRNIKRNLDCDGDPPPDIKYHPYGCLQLANEENAEDLQESWLQQKELGCHVEILTKGRLKQRYPWMNTDGVEVACLGLEAEGWFDAWALHFGLKKKAWFHGTEYIQAEVVGFDFRSVMISVAGKDIGDEHVQPNNVLVRTPSGEVRSIHFSRCIIAAGHESANIAEMARIGRGSDLLSVPLPVEARKRLVYCVQAPEGPGIDCPLVLDTNGTYFRREAYAGHFVAGHSPPLEENPKDERLEVDYTHFENHVWPTMSHRVPGFKSLKLNSAWAGYYDYNRFDQSGVFGPHPYYPHIYFACGFSGHGIIQAPAVARGTMEMLLDGKFRTIDLTKFHFERFFVGKEIKEKHVN